MMNCKELEKELHDLDEKISVLKTLCTPEQQLEAAKVSLDLLKLETLDRFIIDQSTDNEIRQAFDRYRQIALSTIKTYLNTL
ncbi:MAG: hypothetical protein WC703_07770 [Candidatus Neomarinimicrobiota bacterium]